jgi:Flp pilus assembly protein TadD
LKTRNKTTGFSTFALVFVAAAALAALVGAFSAPAFADEVRYLDGRVVAGRIVEDTENHVKIETRNGSVTAVLTIPRSDIASVVYGAPDAVKLRREGYDFLANERFKEAAATFMRVAEIEGASAIAWGDLAFACHLAHEDEEAERAYRKASALAPADGTYIAALGVLFEDAGDEWKALVEFREYAAVSKGSVRGMKLLGVACLRTGDFDNAERNLKKAVELDSTDTDAILALAHVYTQTCRLKEAAALYQNIAAFTPGQPDAWLLMAGIYEKAEMYSEAVGALREALGRTLPEKRETVEMRIRMDEYLGGVKEKPELAGVINFLGADLDNVADAEALERLTASALEINPAFGHAHTLNGMMYLRLDRFGDARIAFQRAAAVATGREQLVAETFEKIAEFKAALQNLPNADGSSNFLGLSIDGQGDWMRALRMSETALLLDPQFSEAHYTAALALMHLERFKESSAELDAYEKMNPAFSDKIRIARELLGRFEADWRRREGF